MQKLLNDFLPDRSAPEKVRVASGMDFTAEYMLVCRSDVQQLLRPRVPFSHKGTYGHALIIAGARATMGAALLSCKACLRGGAGLTTAAIPESGLVALNTALPEVMYAERSALLEKNALKPYNAIAIGPGLKQSSGYDPVDLKLVDLLLESKTPLIADADALNLFAGNKNYLKNIANGSILTPHMKEFDRLFGEHSSWWSRLETARLEAKKRGIIIVLKNQYTFVVDQAGNVHINSTGNPAMAQGGMGDVLTGLIAAQVAQGYSNKDAAILACYLHGMAGDDLGLYSFSVCASDVAEQVPRSHFQLQSFAP